MFRQVPKSGQVWLWTYLLGISSIVFFSAFFFSFVEEWDIFPKKKEEKVWEKVPLITTSSCGCGRAIFDPDSRAPCVEYVHVHLIVSLIPVYRRTNVIYKSSHIVYKSFHVIYKSSIPIAPIPATVRQYMCEWPWVVSRRIPWACKSRNPHTMLYCCTVTYDEF